MVEEVSQAGRGAQARQGPAVQTTEDLPVQGSADQVHCLHFFGGVGMALEFELSTSGIPLKPLHQPFVCVGYF
jgi:hypothetical protein